MTGPPVPMSGQELLSTDPLPRHARQRSSDATPQVHTLDEAAAILRVKKSWLERQAAARKIPFTMLGGSYHFTAAHLAAIVRIHEQMPAPSTAPSQPTTQQRRGRRQIGALPVKPLGPRPRTGPRSAA